MIETFSGSKYCPKEDYRDIDEIREHWEFAEYIEYPEGWQIFATMTDYEIAINQV